MSDTECMWSGKIQKNPEKNKKIPEAKQSSRKFVHNQSEVIRF